MKKVFSVLRRILIPLLLIIFLFSAWQVWSTYRMYEQGNNLYNGLASQMVTDTAAASEEPTEEDEIGITVDFDALRKENPDVVGWLYCPGTVINYPVVQGEDNKYYLHHLLDGTSNKNGTLFVDSNNLPGFQDHNTILYGHHMKSGAMFATLEDYEEQDYYDAHPVLYYLTPEGNYRLEAFSGHTVPASDETYTLAFAEEADYAAWLEKQISKSDFDSDVSITQTDKTVTLSTCAYVFDNARYVLLTKLVPM